jgi:hypothetical protein
VQYQMNESWGQGGFFLLGAVSWIILRGLRSSFCEKKGFSHDLPVDCIRKQVCELARVDNPFRRIVLAGLLFQHSLPQGVWLFNNPPKAQVRGA